MITVKFHMFPSAIYAILFRLEFAKLGTSAFQDTLWNFVVPIIWEKPFKLMKNSASEKRWKPGFLAGVPFNRRLSIPNCFLDVHDLLFGARLAIAKFLASFCHDTLAAAPDEKTCPPPVSIFTLLCLAFILVSTMLVFRFCVIAFLIFITFGKS